MEETVKNYLHVFYKSDNQREATEFFENLIKSKNECECLFDLLIRIFMEEEDENLKKISLVIIREMNCDFILNAIFSLIQKSEPKFHNLIEILSDSLAKQKNTELIPIINEVLSSTDDINTLIAILQIINSLNYINNQNCTQRDNFSKILKEYYSHFFQVTTTIIQSEPILNFNQIIFFNYFATVFLDSKFGVFFNSDFYFNFSCYCFSQKQNDEIFNHLIDIIIDSFHFFFQLEDELKIEMIQRLIECCEETKYIPNCLLSIWPIIFKIERFTLEIDPIISNYIYPFFKFNPELMIYDQEKFLDEFDPDPDSHGDLPLQVFVYLMRENHVNSCIYESVDRFVDYYYKENIESDLNEICRLFNFFSVFARPTDVFTQNFFQNEIVSIMNSLGAMQNPDIFMIIGICQLIKRICYFIDVERDQPFVSMAPTFASFLKWSILYEFNVNEEIAKLLFYFNINAITSLCNVFSIEILDFTREEAYNVFMQVCQIFTEICNDSLTFSFQFLINNMMPLNINIEDFVSMIWELMILHRDDNLLGNLFTIIQNFFVNCSSYEAKQAVFNQFFLNCVINEESKDWLIIKCYKNLLQLLVLFTRDLLDSSEKVPFFIESIGNFIFEMLCNINSDLYPEFFNSYSANSEFISIINEYKYFYYFLIKNTDDPNMCLESIIKPFLIPFIEKTEEIFHNNSFHAFRFTALNAPLIKFKGNEDIFQFLFAYFEDFVQKQKIYDAAKSDLLVSLIISNPSLLFDGFDQDQYIKILSDDFVRVDEDIFVYAIKEILIYLSQDEFNLETINNFAQMFIEKANKYGFVCNQTKFIDEMPYFFQSSLLDYSIYNEDFMDVFKTIVDILNRFGIGIDS